MFALEALKALEALSKHSELRFKINVGGVGFDQADPGGAWDDSVE